MFENLQKNFRKKFQKCCIFAYFAKKFQNQFVKFSRVWTKNAIVWGNMEKMFDENSIEKLNIYLFLGKFVAKNTNLGNNIIFVHFSGGGFEPP